MLNCVDECLRCPVSRIEKPRCHSQVLGACGWPKDLDLAMPEILPAGREFAHIHPDGSLHVWMPVDRAEEAAEKKWGELHPWVDRDDFWDGVVMIYTPETLDEVDVAVQLVVEAYNYITGANLDLANSDEKRNP
jgi:hypothetical protein